MFESCTLHVEFVSRRCTVGLPDRPHELVVLARLLQGAELPRLLEGRELALADALIYIYIYIYIYIEREMYLCMCLFVYVRVYIYIYILYHIYIYIERERDLAGGVAGHAHLGSR